MTQNQQVIGGAVIFAMCLIGFLASLFIAASHIPNPIEAVINNTVSVCQNVNGGDICWHGIRK